MNNAIAPMTYRRLGRTPLFVSVVGFGTCQLRLKSAQQGIDTLKTGFRLGVNLVHTAPDYEGTDNLVAQAVEESGRQVIVASQGYGDLAHFEWLFEETCRKLNKRRLELFGIAAVEDRELLGENVWGGRGMVEFLRRKKSEGRLGATFCTTHGTPEDIARLITCGHFDAVMLAYNALGFHLLSYYPRPPVRRENLLRNESEVFPLAARYGVGLMVMKPLAGGLLCRGQAFPPRRGADSPPDLRAADLLRAILLRPEVTCVVPGTASVAEAEENARAGYAPLRLDVPRHDEIERAIASMRASICSRCGVCDTLCSQGLPVSWLFRDAYISSYPSETFETLDALQYFHLHPYQTATCSNCTMVTCGCPQGIDIPGSLIHLHENMLRLREAGLLPVTLAEQQAMGAPPEPFFCRVISQAVPSSLPKGEASACTLWVHNDGTETWLAPRPESPERGCTLAVFVGGAPPQLVPLRHDVGPGTRTHFAFDIRAPGELGEHSFRAVLAPSIGPWEGERTAEIVHLNLTVTTRPEIYESS
jgi:predicted aldo/keto reductase-like oxidoreductase